jgi:NAD+ synthase (glutamine-hydrolysing)
MTFASLYSHGFVRVAAAVPHMRIGEPHFNAERTIALAGEASEEHAALTIFPELGLSGYSIDDLLHQEALLDAVHRAIGQIASASVDLKPLVVVGGPFATSTASSTAPS